jgi:hypothetical protein
LVISEGTVEVHGKHILGKLGFRSRAQVAVWFARQGSVRAGLCQFDRATDRRRHASNGSDRNTGDTANWDVRPRRAA